MPAFAAEYAGILVRGLNAFIDEILIIFPPVLTISSAKSLLSEGVSLKDVSEAVGFSDYNYFSRLFKKRTGYTPNAFRQTLV